MRSYENRGMLDWKESRGDPAAKHLVVLLHGMDCGPRTISKLVEVVERVTEQPSRVLVPQMPLRWDQCVDLHLLAMEISRYLNDILDRTPMEEVTFIGHSAGGVLAQAVYLYSRQQRDQISSVASVRLILLAPLNRGWTISHHLPLAKKISWTLGMVLSPLVQLKERIRSIFARDSPNPPWILQLRRGSPFLVWIELSWLALKRENGGDLPHVVQMLGSIDEIVSWRDQVATAIGDDFTYIEVPNSDHVTIIDFDHPEHGKDREDQFERALTVLPREPVALRPWDIDPAPPQPDVKLVIFVIHGIRDEGHWTQKIGLRARQVYQEAGFTSTEEVAIVTSSYGYFSMLEFLRPKKRLEKIHWLVDQYVEARRRYPNAKFSYIAHSNGTYLLAHSLKLYPMIRFERIAFAGSVVSSRFDWSSVVNLHPSSPGHPSDEAGSSTGEQMKVLNFTATSDLVVGLLTMIADILPLNWLLGPDLGGAGVEPFKAKEAKSNNYVIGSHSAAIQEDNWTHLARFAVFGVVPSDSADVNSMYASKRSWPLRPIPVKFTCPAILILLLFLVVGYLPLAAWTDPLLFWVVPGFILIITIIMVGLKESALAHLPIHDRLEQRARGKRVVWISIFLLLFWMVAGIGLLNYCSVWGDIGVCGDIGVWRDSVMPSEWARTLSVVTYVLGVYWILTKV